MAERMEPLVGHRKSVVENGKKWDEYLRKPDEKTGIYRERISAGSEEFYGGKRHEP